MASSRLLRVLGHAACLSRGRALHAKMLISGSISAVYAANNLMAMYVKHSSMAYAHLLFDHMPDKNVVSWTILLSGYAKLGPAQEAVYALQAMVREGFTPNDFTYVGAISACTALGALRAGKEIQGHVYRVGGDGMSSHFVSNALIGMYSKCGALGAALNVFDAISLPNSVSWCSIISGCRQCGDDMEALRIFLRARRDGVVEAGNQFVYASVLGACTNLAEVGVGVQLHCHVIKFGFRTDAFIEVEIIHLYAKCSELDHAYWVFSESEEPSLASWTALLGGYAQQGHCREAIDLFSELRASGLAPNEHTLATALLACSEASAAGAAQQLHSLIVKSGFRMISHVGNTLVDVYAKCGLLDESTEVFEKMGERDVVSWNSLIARYVRLGEFGGVAELLKCMLLEGVHANFHTYSNILGFCGDLPSVSWGKQTHACVIKPGFDMDVVVGSSLVDMYAKCGRLADAQKVFQKLTVKNLVSWNSMVIGYAQHGLGKQALEAFNVMQKENIKPNSVTFIGVLTACAHVGLIEEGERYFDCMTRHWGIVPRIQHYACMVDLFARAGKILRALDFIRGMPLRLNNVIWRSLLAGCRTHGHLDMGRYAAECMLKVDPSNVSARIMLFEVYAQSEMWEEGAEMREIKGPKKVSGCSWIEEDNRVHCFIAGDASHERQHEISEILTRLVVQMIDGGHERSTLLLADMSGSSR